eukprot:sb/3478990/
MYSDQLSHLTQISHPSPLLRVQLICGDLPKGDYDLLVHTTSSHFVNAVEEKEDVAPICDEKGALTPQCRFIHSGTVKFVVKLGENCYNLVLPCPKI